jgi:glyoxylase I family protein
MNPLDLKGFSHVCVRVSEMERSLAFYRGTLGFDTVFDVELDGPSLEQVTGEPGAHGRMVGGVLGGTTVELLEISSSAVPPERPERPVLGYTNISFSVEDLDAAHQQLAGAGADPGPPVDIGGVRMFFIIDPDGTPIEIIEYPNGATTSTELWRAG